MNERQTFPLTCHPDTRAGGVASVEVDIRPAPYRMVMLVYRVRPAATLALPDHPHGQADGLWRTTCFELFAQTIGASAYCEFNFAPPLAWAAYDLSDRRAGMTPRDLDPLPHLVDSRMDDRAGDFPATYELDVVLDRRALPQGPTRIGLSAVIEEIDGTKSYWALRHPPGPPDFHHPDCFALELPALDRS